MSPSLQQVHRQILVYWIVLREQDTQLLPRCAVALRCLPLSPGSHLPGPRKSAELRRRRADSDPALSAPPPRTRPEPACARRAAPAGTVPRRRVRVSIFPAPHVRFPRLWVSSSSSQSFLPEFPGWFDCHPPLAPEDLAASPEPQIPWHPYPIAAATKIAP